MNKVLDIISKIGCCFLSILLFLILCIYLGIDMTTKTINKTNVSNIIKELDAEILLSNNAMSTIDDLYQVADENNVDRSVVDGVINSIEFKQQLGEYYGEIVDGILYNKPVKELTATKVITTIESVLERTANSLGYTITSDQRESIMSAVEEKVPKVIEKIPSYNQATKDLKVQDIKAIQTLFSNDSKTVLIVIMLIIVGLMALIRWSSYRFAIWSGTPTILAGGLFAIIGALTGTVLASYAQESLSMSMSKILQNNIFNTITHLGLIVVLVGAVQIVYYVLMNRSYKQERI